MNHFISLVVVVFRDFFIENINENDCSLWPGKIVTKDLKCLRILAQDSLLVGCRWFGLFHELCDIFERLLNALMRTVNSVAA